MSYRRLKAAFVVAAAAASTAALPSAASAACYTSTPQSVTHADSLFDGELGLAPEIGTVVAAVDASCGYSVNPDIRQGMLIEDDSVFIYIDTDGNPATGDSIFTGADRVVGTLGAMASETPPMMGTWNGTSFSFVGGPTFAATSVGGFSAHLDALGIPSGTVTRLQVGSMYRGIYDNYSDFAPEPSQSPMSLGASYSTTPPAPPPPPPPPPPVQQTAGSTNLAEDDEIRPCVVPRVKGRSASSARRRIRADGCDVYGTRRKYSKKVRVGRVIGTDPAAGVRTVDEVEIIVSRGKRPKRSRKPRKASALSVARQLEQRVAEERAAARSAR